ncbi:beta-ketoacyl-ACP synthase III [Deferribacterales bacterium RsTz2092]|nr:putative 3-oxoacyl-[acyl-carrier-protein] synthase 3 [Deferribacterales bacterium]
MGVKSTFEQVRIAGISSAVGENSRTIEDDSTLYGNNIKRINRLKSVLGIHTRHIADSQTTALDLAFQASSTLINDMNIDIATIDGVVFITQTPDYKMPGNAYLLHKLLSLNTNCVVLDLTLGCSGFVYGLWLSFMMASSTCKRVLLCVGDTLSKTIYPKDAAQLTIMGDAVSAILVERCEKTDKTNSYFSLSADGNGYEYLNIPAGGQRLPISEETKRELTDTDGSIRTAENLTMNGVAVYQFTNDAQPPLVDEILAYAGIGREDIIYFIFHQANKYMVENIASKANLPLDKCPTSSFSKYGNTAGASIPLAISDMAEHFQLTTGKYLLQGFGVGLSWGACVLTLDKIYCHLAVAPLPTVTAIQSATST